MNDEIDPDDIIFEVSVNEDQSVYTITVQSMSKKPIDSQEFIIAAEMWLHETVQAEALRNLPGTYVH